MNKRRIVITGATRGLGRAMALELADCGHQIFGCGRDADLVSELRKRLPGHDFTVVDVSSDDAVGRWATRLIDDYGAPDLLLNNAAMMNRPAPLWTLSASELDSIVDINIKGVANVIRHFVPSMVRRQAGVIVNFSSGWGRVVDANVAPYCATKFAIEGMSRALALELPTGLASIPLNPGIIDTDMLRIAWSDGASAFETPDQWAKRAVPFILSLGPAHNGKSLSV